MSEANYVIDDNGQWHDVTLTRRIAKLEAKNAELQKQVDREYAMRKELGKQYLRAVELLRICRPYLNLVNNDDGRTCGRLPIRDGGTGQRKPVSKVWPIPSH
jgi:hypothetical protein